MRDLVVDGARIDLEPGKCGLTYVTSPDERGLFMAFKTAEPIDLDEISDVLLALRALNGRPRWIPLWLANRWIDLRLWMRRR